MRWNKRKKVKFGVRGIALEKVLCKEVALLCSGCHNKTLQNEGLNRNVFSPSSGVQAQGVSRFGFSEGLSLGCLLLVSSCCLPSACMHLILRPNSLFLEGH